MEGRVQFGHDSDRVNENKGVWRRREKGLALEYELDIKVAHSIPSAVGAFQSGW